MNDVRVRLVAECERCDGAGVEESPEWAAWWNRHPDWHGGPVPADDPQPTGPEEVVCYVCRGSGEVEFDMTVAGFAALLAEIAGRS